MTGALLLDNAASVSAPDLSFDGDANTGIYSPGADQVAIATGGTAAVTVDASQNVGIGTTSPDALLTVSGVNNIHAHNASGDASIALSTGGTPASPTQKYTLFVDDSDGDKFIINDSTASQRRLVIDGSGNVGINTTSPNYELSINASNTVSVLQLTNSTTGSTAADGFLSYITGNDVIISNEESGYMRFQTSGAERVRIDSSGNVGIGTSAPSALLDVNGSAEFAGALQSPSLQTYGGYVGTDPTLNEYVVGGGNFTCKSSNNRSGSDLAITNFYGTNRTFSVSCDGSAYFASNVGIGTTSPAKQLHIHNSSTTEAQIQFTDSGTGSTASDGMRVGWNGTLGQIYVYENADLRFATNNTERLRIDSSGRLLVGTSSSTAGKTVIAHGNELGLYTTGPYNFQAKFESTDSEAAIVIEDNNSTNDGNRIGVIGDNMAFTTANTECLRIDSDGRLLVGATSVIGDSTEDAYYAKIVVRGNTASVNNRGQIALCTGAGSATLTNGEGIGRVVFADGDGGTFGLIDCVADGTAGANDYPGRLVFSTTADGASSPTERMRIDSSGQIDFNSNSRIEEDGLFKTAAGTAAAPSHAFLNDPDNGMFRATTNTLGFSTLSA